jgi:prepilin peptidase CpaA
MRYFPDPISGWTFLAAIVALLGIASYTDERYTKVPKWLTIPALVLGLIVSILRGTWLAANGHAVWILGDRGMALGGVDGLLFALSGTIIGFFLFFGLWLLGACGGGDVKLFAAIGAWIGPYLCFLVLILSLLFLSVCLVAVLSYRLFRGVAPVLAGSNRAGRVRLKAPVVVRFSLVAALATVLVLLWAFRADLGLARPPAEGHTAEVSSHAR